MNFKVRDLFSLFHFNTKLLILTIPPMMVIFYLTITNVIEGYSDYKSFSNIEQSIKITSKISVLIHELQKERGMSAAYISSKGSKLKEELLLQQKEVDKISEIKNIENIRTSIMKLEISVYEGMSYYSKLISLYLKEISNITRKKDALWITHDFIAYETFLLYKEDNGIERALGVSLFVNKRFDLELYKKFLSTLSKQESSLRLFKMYADQDSIDFFNKMIKDNSFKETSRMENIILSSDTTTLFDQNPEYWFDTITKKIDILKKVEKNSLSKILKDANERKENIYHDTLVLLIIDMFMLFGVIPIMIYVSKRLHNENKTETKILLQQSKMASIGEMLGAIAHQWRQPLNAVGVLAQEIEFKFEMNVLDLDELKVLNNQLLDNLDYMSTTINDFRDFFKPDKEKKVFNVLVAINESLKIISAQLEIYNIEVEIVSKSKIKGEEDNFYLINGFESEFKQVIINLLQNAKDAIILNKQKIVNKKICVIVQRNKDNLEIKIKDNGGGIKKEFLESMFDIYISSKDAQQGTGLGLYMSKLIIERNMQGELKARNKDDGAEFVITLIPKNME